MKPEEIQGRVRERSFKPFRIFLSDGSSYVVHHPELIVVTRTNVHIASPPRRGTVPDRHVFMDPIHVTRIEPLNGSHARQGRRKKR